MIEFGENVWELPLYEFRALRYAEIYGIIDYKVTDNIMEYTESYPHEGNYIHRINLDTMKEI